MPDRRKERKSRYTADRNIAGAFEGETVTRRRFMTGTAHGAGAIAAAAFGLPALGFALGPVFERAHAHWEVVGVPSEFPNNTYIPKVITQTYGIGEAGKTIAYIRAHNAAIDPPQIGAFLALSNRCAHLGCPVRYVEAAQRFICPCHGGVYDFLGKVAGGPPVRPLDRFATRLRNGQLEVGPRFSVNYQLHAFSPRDPGESVDGIGPILYPARFSTAPKK
jgi:quinol---cytochrome c reductase iron-sulfur subunit, bacillus type